MTKQNDCVELFRFYVAIAHKSSLYPKTLNFHFLSGHSSVQLEDEESLLLRADAFPPFTLEDQVEHKLAFINYHIAPEYRLILIGHSIGAHIILQILKRLDDKGDRVLKAVLLFPTIERITASPSGKFWGALSSYFNYPLALIAFLFSIMPRSVRKSAIEWWLYFSSFTLHSSTVNATLSFLNYHSMMHSLQTGRDIACVCDVDFEPIAKNLEKLIFYYGIDDPYVPISYIDDMRERFPAADIKICKDNIKHAFVLDSSEKMAKIVWEWLFMDLV